jgi:GntR family transcriptional regulator, transcriptional repressor for pyruvate dehydrogenase complex
MFNPIKTRGRLSEIIYDQIKDSIINGSIKPGEKLSTEKELMEQFQVSRIPLREAMKRLEASGLVKINPGTGMYVRKLTSKGMSEHLSMLLRLQKTSLNELTESRILFEPNIAKLAAERITELDIIKLEKNIQLASSLIESKCSASETNIAFHALVAQATHNTVVALSMETFFSVLTEMTINEINSLETRLEISRQAVKAHIHLLSALKEKDPKKSYQLMLDDILNVQSGFQKSCADKR